MLSPKVSILVLAYISPQYCTKLMGPPRVVLGTALHCSALRREW